MHIGGILLDLDVVLPCWNESQNIERMVSSFIAVQKEMQISLRVTFIDDGSHDDTWTRIEEEVTKHANLAPSGLCIRGIRLSRHLGKGVAQAVGLRYSEDSKTVIVMDGDGQHPVSSVPTFVAESQDHVSLVIGSRVAYSRSLISGVGTLGLRVIMRGLGIRFDPRLSEFLAVPRPIADEAMQSPKLGVIPLVPLLRSISNSYVACPVEIAPRSSTGEKSRWKFTELWRKALLEVLADPWRLLPRITLLAVTSFLALFLASLVAGIHAVLQGTSPGTVAILGSVVVLTALSVAMWVSSMVVSVLSLRLIENAGQSGPDVSMVYSSREPDEV